MPYLIANRFQKAKKLYWRFEFPCMCLAILLGVVLLVQNPHKLKIGWFHMKLTAAFLLIGLDLWIGTRKEISKRMQWALQSTTVLLLIAVLFAILKAKVL